MSDYDLNRFVAAQNHNFDRALTEVKAGRKRGHWIWFIFPQLTGLGHSFSSAFYGIEGLDEARAYLANKTLSDNLVTIAKALTELKGKDIYKIFRTPDDLKVCSSMTLFYHAADDEEKKAVFKAVIDKYYKGKFDPLTEKMLGIDN